TNRANKADPDRGVEMCFPLYRDQMVDLPYSGYEERMYSDAFKKEAVAWPEGDSTDLVMHHWFLEIRLDDLLVAATPTPIIEPERAFADKPTGHGPRGHRPESWPPLGFVRHTTSKKAP